MNEKAGAVGSGEEKMMYGALSFTFALKCVQQNSNSSSEREARKEIPLISPF